MDIAWTHFYTNHEIYYVIQPLMSEEFNIFEPMKKIFILLVLLVMGGLAYCAYNQIYVPIDGNSKSNVEFIIPTEASLEDIGNLLSEKKLIRNKEIFHWVAKKKNYPKKITPGKYSVKGSISLNDLINQLRVGETADVKFTFNNVFSMKQLAGKAGGVLAYDSAAYFAALDNAEMRNHYGFTKQTYPTMFIPNTYEFKWDTSPEAFVKRMAREYKSFWNEDRTNKRNALNLTTSEVVTLASIVQAEQQAIPSEWKRIAGLYLNRVRKGMPLQSDPTVKFSVGDWSIKRVLTKHLKHESPYNTYLHAGIPPGPILFPDIGAIDAVLNAESHSYYYMCAKADFSGKHEFAKNLSLHNKYAAAYRKALNNRKIYN